VHTGWVFWDVLVWCLLQPIREAALGNIPVIAFCDTDSPMRHVDISIPANNKGKHSIGCLFWLLGRMVLQMRGTITPSQPWDVMVSSISSKSFFVFVPSKLLDHVSSSSISFLELWQSYCSILWHVPGCPCCKLLVGRKVERDSDFACAGWFVLL
jgi:hypothetical protein